LRLTAAPSKTAGIVEAQIYRWLHLLGFGIHAGATAAVLLIGVPLARGQSDPSGRLRSIAGFMRVYDPLSIAALGVVVMTGAFSLTRYKAVLGVDFFTRVGAPLAWKLLFAFLLINLGAYVAFGIGHRLVVRFDLGEPVEAGWLDSMLRRLQISSALALALVAVIVWIAAGLRLAPAPAAPAPPAPMTLHRR
jgi:hypothetical protein